MGTSAASLLRGSAASLLHGSAASLLHGSAASLLRGSAGSRSQLHHDLCKVIPGSALPYAEVRYLYTEVRVRTRKCGFAPTRKCGFEVPSASLSVQIRTRKYGFVQGSTVRGPNFLTICANSYKEVGYVQGSAGSRPELPHDLCKVIPGSAVLYKEVRFEVPIAFTICANSYKEVRFCTRKWVMYKEVRFEGISVAVAYETVLARLEAIDTC